MSEIIIGGCGFAGETTVKGLLSYRKNVLAPNHSELDISNLLSIKSYLGEAEVVVNFAAFTNVKEATLDPDGPAWKLNVEGARNVAKVCKEKNIFLIHLSTDGVFPLSDNFQGPHPESEKIIDNPDLVSPYSYTKLRGEMEVIRSGARAAILRIAYPFGNSEFPDKDYVLKLLKSIKLGYPLFGDQQLTPTYLKSLPEVIGKLSKMQLSGVFHWVCKGLTTPYDIGVYVNEKLGMGLNVKKGSLAEFEKSKGKQPYAKYGGLSTILTEKRLGVIPPTWQEAINNFSSELKPAIDR